MFWYKRHAQTCFRVNSGILISGFFRSKCCHLIRYSICQLSVFSKWVLQVDDYFINWRLNCDILRTQQFWIDYVGNNMQCQLQIHRQTKRLTASYTDKQNWNQEFLPDGFQTSLVSSSFHSLLSRSTNSLITNSYPFKSLALWDNLTVTFSWTLVGNLAKIGTCWHDSAITLLTKLSFVDRDGEQIVGHREHFICFNFDIAIWENVKQAANSWRIHE